MKPVLVTAALLALAAPAIAPAFAQTTVKQALWGQSTEGKPVKIFTLTDSTLTVRLAEYGARIVSIQAPDRNGKQADVVLGYDSLAAYEADSSTYFGAIVGRYGNRIAKGRFTLDGHQYQIPVNNNGNALHGGPQGFDTKVWTGKAIPNGVEFTLISPDGDEGFPGTLTTHVRYTLLDKSLHIDFSATTTKPTVLNLTNHAYFNLNGNGQGTILNHILTLDADRYTPVDSTQIPTGQLAPVAGTPFDFRTPTRIGARIGQDNEQLKIGGTGYDHNFVLNHAGPPLHLAAVVFDPESGRTLTVTTTQPGVQFYSGNSLKDVKYGESGRAYPKYSGFALETQHFPDSPNQPAFPTTTLLPGRTFHSTTVFTFTAG